MTRSVLIALSVLIFASELTAQSPEAAFAKAEIISQRAGIALSGGNPLAGASSTLGLRLGALPRISAAARFTAARVVLPSETTGETDDLSSIAHSLSLDAAVGIFGGFSLVPTVGGFGSIDLLGSYGKLSLSDDDGFADDPTSWGAGVRVGILRESFTAPGISVSAMYRSIGDVTHIVGEPDVDAGTITSQHNNSAVNLRATVGKRILMLGAVVGVGYDKFYSDATFTPPETLPPTPVMVRHLETSATTLFGNLSWTMLILHIVGEGGVQRADGESALYGSLAIRLAL
jgi:hypothetical protein